MIKKFRLDKKVVLVTGGAGFLGNFFVDALLDMGATAIILDKSAEAITKTLQRFSKKQEQVSCHQLDIIDNDRIKQIVKEIVSAHGRIDILVNAAAFAMKDLNESVGDFFAKFEDYDQSLWQIALDVNLTGTFLITQAVGKVMKRQQKGVIVNVASDVAIISPDHRIYEPDEKNNYSGVPFNTPMSYSVAKAGILSFTRYLATYWAKDGIRVNSISPAGVYRNQDPNFVEQLSFRIPLGRMAKPEELKGPLVFLCSEASSFITGTNLIVDGGRTIW